MPIKFETRCKACKLTKIDRQFKRRIFESSYFSDHGLESLKTIHADYKHAFAYDALLRHCTRHIMYTEKEQQSLNRKHGLLKSPTTRAPSTNPIQPNALAPVADNKQEDEVFDSVMELGLDKLKKGELQIKTTDLINAAKTKSELKLKKKDQELKIQEMIWHFASGENERNLAYDERIIEGETATTYNAAAITSENVSRRKT